MNFSFLLNMSTRRRGRRTHRKRVGKSVLSI